MQFSSFEIRTDESRNELLPAREDISETNEPTNQSENDFGYDWMQFLNTTSDEPRNGSPIQEERTNMDNNDTQSSLFFILTYRKTPHKSPLGRIRVKSHQN